VFPRLDEWLAKVAPRVAKGLRGPASAAALRQLTRHFGRVPDAVLQMYRAHDGESEGVELEDDELEDEDEFDDEGGLLARARVPREHVWIQAMRWLPIAEVIREHTVNVGAADWPDDWLPLATDGGGNFVVVAGDGEVFAWDHETGEPETLASSLDAWFGALADDLEASTRSAPVAAQAPRRAGAVLIEVLEEHRFVEMDAEASPEEVDALVGALEQALARRGVERQLEGVLAALEGSKAVAEIFADDEVLAVLLKEFA